MLLFNCEECGHQLYFESTRCVRCESELGYVPAARAVTVLAPADGPSVFTVRDPGAANTAFRRCDNFEAIGCNWLTPAGRGGLCDSCVRSTHVPDLSIDENRARWSTLEAAKRRLLFTLDCLGLSPLLDASDDDHGDGAPGLSFRFLRSSDAEPVVTGHADGVVTIDIAEADATHLAAQRRDLGERYRTPLGHLRHETGHYFFLRLFPDDSSKAAFRDLFGDETADYQAALDRHYENGPPADWATSFVSAYASMHPAEDWAETFAHYLHMVDTLETAAACGLSVAQPLDCAVPNDRVRAGTVDFADVDELLEAWSAVALALNSLNRSMGHPDAYPFALSAPAAAKLRFAHDAIAARSAQG